MMDSQCQTARRRPPPSRSVIRLPLRVSHHTPPTAISRLSCWHEERLTWRVRAGLLLCLPRMAQNMQWPDV